MDSGSANGSLQAGATVYYGWMVKVTLPERFGPPSHLKEHREAQQGREGKQNGSPQRHGLLDRCIAGSQPKTASALRDQFQIKHQVGNAGNGALDSFVQLGKR
jgi:hypothetical protein